MLTALKSSPVPMGLVHDEYGHFEGIVTPADVMEAIVGVFRADTDESEPPAVRRADGSWLLAGYLPADEMADHLIIALPEKRDYQTVGRLHPGQSRPSSGDGGNVRRARLAVRSRRHGRAAHRQGAGDAASAHAAARDARVGERAGLNDWRGRRSRARTRVGMRGRSIADDSLFLHWRRGCGPRHLPDHPPVPEADLFFPAARDRDRAPDAVCGGRARLHLRS